MSVLSVRSLARQERQEFADLLATLTPRDWSAASLCAGWSVRDVVTHTIAYLGQRRTRLFVDMVAAGWDIDALNGRGLAGYAGTPPEHLVALMRDGVEPVGAGALYGCRVALIECLVHQQDVRRPLGRPRRIPAERLLAALMYARHSPVIRGARSTRGVRLVATDTDWSAGRGPEVHGTGEALLLAMTGRIAHVADELTGPGADSLRRRSRRD